MSFLPLVLSLVFWAAQSSAIIVQEPNSQTIWTSPGPNQVAWKNQNGDPTEINLQLIPHTAYVLGFPLDGIFATNVSVDGFIYVFTPACLPGLPDDGARLPTGTGFQINFIDSANGTVIETSEPFDIVSAATTTCATGAPMSVVGSPTSSAEAGGSTGAVASGVSKSHSDTGAIIGGTIAGVIFVLLIGAAGMWLRKRRRDRRQATMAYGLRLRNRLSISGGDSKAGVREAAEIGA
ncbi:hypothetical protein HWV62_16214 [Athelia sp. TMB]|nr:hypothetical protein HWV62_16214 [Athelia sp. TMB]